MSLEARLPPTRQAPAEARGLLDRLEGRVASELLDEARLLVSELVTNSVKYGGDGPIRLEVTAAGDRVRAEIIDQGAGFTPAARDGELDRVGGWGLHLVQRLASKWGTYAGSTHVWFEIDARERRRSRRR